MHLFWYTMYVRITAWVKRKCTLARLMWQREKVHYEAKLLSHLYVTLTSYIHWNISNWLSIKIKLYTSLNYDSEISSYPGTKFTTDISSSPRLIFSLRLQLAYICVHGSEQSRRTIFIMLLIQQIAGCRIISLFLTIIPV